MIISLGPLFVRALVGATLTLILILLTLGQMPAASRTKQLTVEQGIYKLQKIGLTWDRHYPMVIDLCIISFVTGLNVFVFSGQWRQQDGILMGLISVAVMLIFLIVWGKTSVPEPHVNTERVWFTIRNIVIHPPSTAGWFHGIFFAIALWGFLMVLIYTPRPDPGFLFATALAVPAFLFVAQHMFLGLIMYFANEPNSWYKGNPLKDPMGWAVFLGGTILTEWRIFWQLIPQSYWDSIR